MEMTTVERCPECDLTLADCLANDPALCDRNSNTPAARLEYLRGELRAERISYGELAELQGLTQYIDPGDVELLEAAGVPEFGEEREQQARDYVATQADDNDEDDDIPADFPVRPLRPTDPAKDRVTCGTCERSWDDGISTSMTPAPSARCPFEEFHDDESDEDDESDPPTPSDASTARPWRYETRPDGFIGDTYQVRSAAGPIACVIENEADAALIVQAVNSFDGLVDALRGLVAAAKLAERELIAWSNSNDFEDVHGEGNDYSKALRHLADAMPAALRLAGK